jgi:hypothetical protein
MSDPAYINGYETSFSPSKSFNNDGERIIFPLKVRLYNGTINFNVVVSMTNDSCDMEGKDDEIDYLKVFLQEIFKRT